MNTAYSYVRFSSKPQELGDSVRRQVALARAYATKHNLVLDERSYRDLGISAFKGKNAAEGALGAFLKAVDDGVIPANSTLLVESLDRVSRAEVMDALSLFMAIIKRGIRLVTLSDEQLYTEASISENWTKLIMALAVMARANEESTIKSKRVKAAWETKRASGKIMTATCPAWLEVNEKRTAFVIVPDKAKVVEKIFELAAAGKGSPSIANYLNEKGIPTMARAEYWEPTLVMGMLKNSAVIGRFTPKKVVADPIENYYPAIIKPEIFHLVQEHIVNRRGTGGPKGATVSNLFSGLMQCECGSKMKFVSSGRYIRCAKAYSNVGCDAPAMPYKLFEDWMLIWICHFEEVDLGFGDRVLEDPTIVLRGELEEKRKRAQQLVDALGLTDGTGASMPTIMKNLTKLEEQIADLEKAIKLVRTPTPVSDALSATYLLWKKLETATDGERYDLRLQLQAGLRTVIDKIVVEREVRFTPRTPQEEIDAIKNDLVEVDSKFMRRKTPSTEKRTPVEYEPVKSWRLSENAKEQLKSVVQDDLYTRHFYISGKLVELLADSFLKDINGLTPDGKALEQHIGLPAWGLNGASRRRVRTPKTSAV